jgi:hypothetical protein
MLKVSPLIYCQQNKLLHIIFFISPTSISSDLLPARIRDDSNPLKRNQAKSHRFKQPDSKRWYRENAQVHVRQDRLQRLVRLHCPVRPPDQATRISLKILEFSRRETTRKNLKPYERRLCKNVRISNSMVWITTRWTPSCCTQMTLLRHHLTTPSPSSDVKQLPTPNSGLRRV